MMLDELVARSHRNTARSAELCSQSQAAILLSQYLAFLFRPLIGGASVPLLSRAQRTAEKMRSGGLPAPNSEKVWAGRGSLTLCSGRDELIKGEEREFELDVLDTLTLRFHAECLRCGPALAPAPRFRAPRSASRRK